MTATVYTIRSLRANLREALATVRETGTPAIIAERGERPVAVLVDYASWAAQYGENGWAEAAPAPVAQRAGGDSGRDPLLAVERTSSLPAGWGGESTPTGSNSDAQAAIPPGWRVAAGGWGV